MMDGVDTMHDLGDAQKNRGYLRIILKTLIFVGVAVALYTLHQSVTLTLAGYTLTMPLYVVWCVGVALFLSVRCVRGLFQHIFTLGARMQSWRQRRRMRHMKGSLSHSLTQLTVGDFTSAEHELFSFLADKAGHSKNMSSLEAMWCYLTAFSACAQGNTPRARALFENFLKDSVFKNLGVLGLYRTKFYELLPQSHHALHNPLTIFFMHDDQHREMLGTFDVLHLKELAHVLEQGLTASKKSNTYAAADQKLLNATTAHPWIVQNLLNLYTTLLEKSSHGVQHYYERADILKRVAYDRRIITKTERNVYSARMIWSRANTLLHDRDVASLGEKDLQSVCDIAFDSHHASESLDGPVIFLHDNKPSPKTYKMLLNVMQTHPTQKLMDAILRTTPATAQAFASVEKKLCDCDHPLIQSLLSKLAHKAQLWGRAKQIAGEAPCDNALGDVYKKAS